MPENLEAGCVAESDADLDAVVARVSAGVLETMFFEEAVETECQHAWLQSAITTELHFNGSHDGCFFLSVSPEAARAIAAGFLGLDAEELADGQGAQVILELTNILCGAIMSHLWPESSLSLDSPLQVVPEQVPSCTMHRCFQLPDGPVAIFIHLHSGVQS